jgi:hypothetical protein
VSFTIALRSITVRLPLPETSKISSSRSSTTELSAVKPGQVPGPMIRISPDSALARQISSSPRR